MTKSFTLHISEPAQCSYLDNKKSRSEVIVPPYEVDSYYYASLLRQGFRRSGIFVYRPHCTPCQACISLRVDVNRFITTKRFKRIINKTNTYNVVNYPYAGKKIIFNYINTINYHVIMNKAMSLKCAATIKSSY